MKVEEEYSIGINGNNIKKIYVIDNNDIIQIGYYLNILWIFGFNINIRIVGITFGFRLNNLSLNIDIGIDND